MSEFNQDLPIWPVAGTKPTDEAIAKGWQPKDRPPAAWFNWAWHQTYECIKEIRDFIDARSSAKINVPFININLVGDTYSAISAVNPALQYEDGMTINVQVNGNSVDSSKLKLDELDAVPIFAFGQATHERTLVDGRLYTLVYSEELGGWYILNVVNKVEIPPIFFGDLNTLLYDAYFVNGSTATNLPVSTIENDSFFITSKIIRTPDNKSYIYQVAKSIYNFEEYNRLVEENGTPLTGWTNPVGSSAFTAVVNMSLFDDLAANGLGVSYSPNSPYNIQVDTGYVYTSSNGLIMSNIVQTLEFAEVVDGNYYVLINKAGNCSLVLEGSAMPQYAAILGMLTVLSAQITGYETNLKPLAISSKTQAFTQPKDTNNKTIATTEYVMEALSGASGSSKLYTDFGEITKRQITIESVSSMEQLIDIPIVIRSSFTTQIGSITTLNVNNYGEVQMLFPPSDGSSLTTTPQASFAEVNGIYEVVYNGTNFVVAKMDYKKATAVTYGIVKASASVPEKPTEAGAVGSDNGLFARGNHSHPKQKLEETSKIVLLELSNWITEDSGQSYKQEIVWETVLESDLVVVSLTTDNEYISIPEQDAYRTLTRVMIFDGKFIAFIENLPTISFTIELRYRR